MALDYSGQTEADVQAILASVPVSTKNAIIQNLAANGLLGPNSHIGVVSEVNPGTRIHINQHQDQLVLLSPNSATQVNSTGPVIIGASTGSNYIDISHNAAHQYLDQPDTVVGGSGSDYIQGNTAADKLIAGSGTEMIFSGGGKDTILGGSGNDTLTAGGQSLVIAGPGNIVVNAGGTSSAHDTIRAGTGNDSITLTAGNNTVYSAAGGGKATITAGSGKDTIYGPSSGSAETINGGAQTTLNLGTGSVQFNVSKGNNDTIFGGSGAGYLNLNQLSPQGSGGTTTATATTVSGQSATTFTFANGGSVTTVGSVNVTFTDTRKPGT